MVSHDSHCLLVSFREQGLATLTSVRLPFRSTAEARSNSLGLLHRRIEPQEARREG
jgi:hypothetical protein